ncbi:MAG: fasciclin domain-containing protein, partial [Pseudonocardia sp.]|nr:fasciclin domain-containing protein [Pseudonocardia sp.]
ADDVFGAACSALPQGSEPGGLEAMGPQPVATAASTNPLLTTLVAAVGMVDGLGDTLNSAPALTVYAPVDDAFAATQAAVGDEAFNALLADQTALGGLLSYHVSGTRYDRDSLVEAGTSTQLAGGEVTVADAGDTITLTGGDGNSATVLCGNIPTSNATVFAIDAVLMPAS